MHVFGIDVVFLVVVSFWKLPDFSASEACSCYSFHRNSSSKQVGRQYCIKGRGDLVSIETTEEWSFIKNQLQNKTIENGYKEYWIGLEKEGGNWKWLNNHTEPPTVKVWNTSPTEPEGRTNFTIAYHSENSSLFLHAVTNETSRKGWICEYKNKDCRNVERGIVCKQVLVKTTSTSTTITTMNTYTTTIPITTTWMTSTTTTTTTTRPTTVVNTVASVNKTTAPPIKKSTTKPKILTKPRPTTVVNTVASVNKTTAPPITNPTTKPKILTNPRPTTMTPKVAKLTSAAPSTEATTASATERPFFIGILTTTSPVHECLSDPYLVVAISVSVIGGVTVLFFTALFLFVACRNKCSRPQRKVEKVEMEEGEYENHL